MYLGWKNCSKKKFDVPILQNKKHIRNLSSSSKKDKINDFDKFTYKFSNNKNSNINKRKNLKYNSNVITSINPTVEESDFTIRNLYPLKKNNSKSKSYRKKKFPFSPMKINQSSIEKKRNEKIRRSLNNYISKNKREISLTGNKRYDSKSGEYYIKNKNDDSQLIPIPILRKPSSSINSNEYSKKNLKKAREKAVLLRRISYAYDVKERTNQSIENLAYKIYNKKYIILIQRWWRTIMSVIMIQKNFRGFILRKKNNFNKKYHKIKIYENMHNIHNKVIKKVSDKIPIMNNIKRHNITPQHYKKSNRFNKISPNKINHNKSSENIHIINKSYYVNSNVMGLIRKIKNKFINHFG